MALIATVNRVSAKKTNDGMPTVAIKLILLDSGVEVINQNFTQVHNPANDISIARNELLNKAQDAINNYKTDKVLFDSAAFMAVVDYIETNLEV